MKKTLLFGLGVLASFALSAQTITASDLKWTVNNKWPGSLYAESGSGLDLTTGTGKTWDLTGYSVGVKDTIFALAPSGTGDIKIKSTLLGELDYKNTGSDFALAGALVSGLGFTPVDNFNAVMGLPHTQGGSSNSSTTAGGFFAISVAISSVSSGTVTTAYGSFSAVLVKESITGAYTRETYYIETVEYGRVAAFISAQSKIWVAESPIQVGVGQTKGKSGISVYPNPTSNVLNVNASAGTLTIYNALGNVVKQVKHNGGTASISVADLKKGLYIVQLVTATGVQTASVVVE